MALHFNPSDLVAQLFTWTSTPTPPDPNKTETALACVQRHLKDYDGMSKRARFKYNYLKLTQIVCAALIPLASTQSPACAGGLGVAVVVASGVEIAGQYYDKWLRWRATWQSLDLEREAYEHKTDGYAGSQAEADARLIDRVRAIREEEHVLWHKSSHGKDKKDDKKPPDPPAQC